MVCILGFGDCGGDSVSTASTTSSQSGAAQTGDDSNANVITGNTGNVTVDNSVEYIDPGAIQAGLSLAETAEGISTAALATVPLITNRSLDTVDEAILSNENIASDAFDANVIVSKDAIDLSGDALITVENVVSAAGGFGVDALDSVDNAVITVENVTEDALGFGKDALDTVDNSVISNENVVEDALGFGNDALDTVDNSFYTIETVINAANTFGKDALDTVDKTVIALESTVKSAVGVLGSGVSDITDSIDDITASSERIAKEALFTSTTNSQIVADSLESSGALIAAASNNVVTSLTDLQSSRSIDTANVLDAVTTLGATVSTGGENLKQDLNKLLIGGVVLVLGVVAWQAVQS